VPGGVVGEEPPGEGLFQRAVQAAVYRQDVLGVQPARLAVFAAADAELVVDALHLERLQSGEELGADVGADVVGQQGAVAGDRAGPAGGLDVDQPAVQVLVDGELVRLQREAAAALQLLGHCGLGLLAGGVAAEGGEAAFAVRAAWQLDPGVPAQAPARAFALR
jgi:hypothetical protein